MAAPNQTNGVGRITVNKWTMCEFHDSNGNGFGDIWQADKLIYLVVLSEFWKHILLMIFMSRVSALQ